MNENVLFGIDIFLKQYQSLKRKNIALVCNSASLTHDGEHSRIALIKNKFNIIKIFSPEHGFDALGEDGAFISNMIDSITGLPIVSLYGDHLYPTEEDMDNIDIILIDLPDIGARFYTYLWTMTYVMESCEKFNKKVFVLDRPNPLAYDIDLVEGPLLNPDCASFIGRFPIPITHHCTFGELANYFKHQYYSQLDLVIIPMKNWSRKENNGYHFTPTSPAIQHRETVYTYPGFCLFEGLNINEGRGSEFPFSQFGAPWIDTELLYNAIKDIHANIIIHKVSYIPTFGLYAGELCYGLRVIPTMKNKFKSIEFIFQVIQSIHQLFPNKLEERKYPTNANKCGTGHLDKLIGIKMSFEKLIHKQINQNKHIESWKNDILPFLIYKK